MLCQQLADGLRELRSLRSPVVDAIALEVDAGRAGAWVVGAHDLDRAAVAGAVLFDNNDAVVRLLAGANARQTNHQHLERSSQRIFEILGSGAVLLAADNVDTARGRNSPNT